MSGKGSKSAPVSLVTRTHARDQESRGAASSELDRAILNIAHEMAQGQWVTGVSHQSYAEGYGVTVETIRDWASHAARFLRLSTLPDVADLRAKNAATLETIAAGAMLQGDAKAAVAAIAEANRLQGLTQPAGGANVAVQVNVSLEQHPEYQQLEQRIVDALEPFPEARIAVARALRSG